ncbi:hypothetical protein PFISCL1PPCAC_25738, partial [Pristionchus fissidentatus]
RSRSVVRPPQRGRPASASSIVTRSAARRNAAVAAARGGGGRAAAAAARRVATVSRSGRDGRSVATVPTRGGRGGRISIGRHDAPVGPVASAVNAPMSASAAAASRDVRSGHAVRPMSSNRSRAASAAAAADAAPPTHSSRVAALLHAIEVTSQEMSATVVANREAFEEALGIQQQQLLESFVEMMVQSSRNLSNAQSRSELRDAVVERRGLLGATLDLLPSVDDESSSSSSDDGSSEDSGELDIPDFDGAMDAAAALSFFYKFKLL